MTYRYPDYEEYRQGDGPPRDRLVLRRTRVVDLTAATCTVEDLGPDGRLLRRDIVPVTPEQLQAIRIVQVGDGVTGVDPSGLQTLDAVKRYLHNLAVVQGRIPPD